MESYSMAHAWPSLLAPLLDATEARCIVEIGAEHGDMTERLAAYCTAHNGTVHSIDTAEPPRLGEMQERYGSVLRFHRGASVAVLPHLRAYDTVIIDGDHTWYTVTTELQIIEQEAHRTGTMPLVVLHDCGWPWGRRDSYANTDAIPPAFQQPMAEGRLRLAADDTTEDEADACTPSTGTHGAFARYAHTPKNGVRTAAEDFVRARPGLRLHVIEGWHGLGILADDALLRRRPALSAFLRQWQWTPAVTAYVQSLEHARLRALEHIADDAMALEEARAQALRSDADLADMRTECEKRIGTMHDALERAQSDLRNLRETQDHLQEKNGRALRRIGELEQDLHDERRLRSHMHGTLSWRITQPLRRAGALLHRRTVTPQTLAPSPAATPEAASAPGISPDSGGAPRRTPPNADAILARARSGTLRLPEAVHPRVSIIIPVYNQVAFTYACLESIAADTDAPSYEVIVVDDGSTDATQELLGGIPHLRLLRNSRNLGFTHTCNRGASEARGAFLCFLNNDTLVQPGWLSALLRTFEDCPDVGLAGAMFLAPDGSVLEAGGAVWRDGSATNIGRGMDAQDPACTYLRDVAYCSGAGIVIPTKLFRSLGGFDARFAPAYYEDTDLAFAVRAAGLRTVCQPAARIIHYEGATAGTDVQTGAKRYQVINRAKFRNKWESELQHMPEPPTHITPDTLRTRPAVLVIDEVLPLPDRDSGSLRMREMLRILRRMTPSVSLAVRATNALLSAGADALRAEGIETYLPDRSSFIRSFLATHASAYDVIILSRADIAYDCIEDVRYYAPHARILFDTVDLHYLRQEREAALTGDRTAARDARERRSQEIYTMRHADAVLTVSEEEAARVRDAAPDVPVCVVSNIHHVARNIPRCAAREGLLFVGNFLHRPNIDGITWFVREIFPLVRRRIPEMHLWIVGGDVPPVVADLAGDSITVTGHIPDIDTYLHRCRLNLAPLRFGAGVKGKILTGMAAGLPVVSTSIGAEGIGLHDGEDAAIADTPETFAAAVIDLYHDADRWQRYSDAGVAHIAERFSPACAEEGLRRALHWEIPPAA